VHKHQQSSSISAWYRADTGCMKVGGLPLYCTKHKNISICIILCFYILQSAQKKKKSHTPVCDPLWSHYFLSSELLYFAVGQVSGNDMCGFGASVIDMKLPAMQHHQSAQLICTGNCKHWYKIGAQLGNTGLSPACNVSQNPFHFIFPNNLSYSSI